MFDEVAFREAWFNACLHNNWVEKTPPAIYIFNDRLEIISTGGLPNNMTKKDFFSGISRPVNIILTRIFIQLGLIEQTGHGVLLVVEKYGKNAFEFLDNFLKVTIPFNSLFKTTQENQNTTQENRDFTQETTQEDQNTTQETTQENNLKANDKSLSMEERIINLIKLNNKLTRKKIAQLMGLSEEGVKYYLNKMKKNGKIEHVGSTKSGYWNIIK